MKKKFGMKARILGLALLAAGATTAAPAVVPQAVMAAETAATQSSNGMYSIVRKINIYYVNEDGSTTFGGSAPYTYSVSNKSMKVTFPEIKVADLFGGDMGYWKPDRDTLPVVTATVDNPPAEENIYLRMDTSSYTEESKTITRTINYYYVDANGKKSTAGVYKDSVTFKRPGYIDSKGNKIMDDWSGDYTFKEIAVAEKAGYTANMTKVPAKTVKPTDSDFTVEVLYSKIPTTTETKDITRTINYIYKDTNRTFKTYTQKVTLSREVATVNGKTTVVRDWSEGQFSAHKVDAVSGYTADTQTVPALKVTSGSKNSSVNVYFAKSEDNVKDNVSFLVTFTDGQGKTLKTEEVESGKGATAPANPTRSGYTFAGWDKSFSNITAPTTVNAKWTKNNEPVNETKTVTRTVKFMLKYEDGKTSDYKTMRQSATFSRTGYVDAKGNKVMPDWPAQTWEAIKAPTLDGFVAEKSEVPAVTFTPDTAPGDVVVYLNQLPTKTEYKTVKRTINLIGKNADGTTTSLGNATQSVTINREVYTDADGKTQVKRDWNTGTLGEYKVPDRTGYVKQQASVAAVTVTGKSKDITVDVYYTKGYTGAKWVSGVLTYFEGGVKNTTFTGITTTTAGNDVYFKDGVFQKGYTGIIKDSRGTEKLFKKGVFAKTFTGAKWIGGVLTYFENGVKGSSFTGITRTEAGSDVYFKDGVFQNKFTGVLKDSNGAEKLFKKGVFANKFTGAKWISGVLTYFENGVKGSNFTGITRTEAGSDVYFKNGVFQKGFTGKYQGYNIKKGIVVK